MDQVSFYSLVGKSIREAREKRGLTQKALASLVSLTRTSITNIERGKQKLLLHTLVELAEALKLPPSKLLADAVDPSSARTDWHEVLRDHPRIEQLWIRAALQGPGKRR
jgi:transcriptional regulator with XRE-family HTH domain